MASKRNPAVEFLKKTLVTTTEGVGAKLTAEDVLPRAGAAQRSARLLPEPKQRDIDRTVEKITKDQDLDGLDQMILEAIIIPDKRPAVDIINGSYFIEQLLWSHFETDEQIRSRIEAVIPCVGRIDLPGNDMLPFAGTGFVVGDGLIMTNRHVASIFAGGPGDLSFQPGASAAVDFLRERPVEDGDGGSLPLTVISVEMIHPYWDMALLRVEGLTDRNPLVLSLQTPESAVDRDVALIGYPAFDPRNNTDVQNRVFGGVYNVKRLMPGKLTGRKSTASFGKQVSSATHDASTLGGASGSCVVDTETGEIIALHFGGQYLKTNYGVACCDLAKDGHVIDAGVNFAGEPARAVGEWDNWWNKLAPAQPVTTDSIPRPGQTTGTVDTSIPKPDATLRRPLSITVRVDLAD